MGGESQTWTSGQKERMEVNTPVMGKMVTITRADLGLEWQLAPDAQIYQERPLAAVVTADTSSEDELSEEDQALADQFFGGFGQGAGSRQTSGCSPTLEKLSAKRTVAGYQTTAYGSDCAGMGGSSVYWMAPLDSKLKQAQRELKAYQDALMESRYANYPPAERKRVIESMQQFGQMMHMATFGGGVDIEQMKNVMPLAVGSVNRGGGSVESAPLTFEIRTIEVSPANPALFEVPSSYTQVNDIGQAMAGKMIGGDLGAIVSEGGDPGLAGSMPGMPSGGTSGAIGMEAFSQILQQGMAAEGDAEGMQDMEEVMRILQQGMPADANYGDEGGYEDYKSGYGGH